MLLSQSVAVHKRGKYPRNASFGTLWYRRLLTVCLFLYPAGATVLHKKAYYLLIYEKIIDNLKNKVIKFFQYLYTVLLYMPDYMNSSAGIEQLMPWSDFIKEKCSGLINVESNVPENRIPLPLR